MYLVRCDLAVGARAGSGHRQSPPERSRCRSGRCRAPPLAHHQRGPPRREAMGEWQRRRTHVPQPQRAKPGHWLPSEPREWPERQAQHLGWCRAGARRRPHHAALLLRGLQQSSRSHTKGSPALVSCRSVLPRPRTQGLGPPGLLYPLPVAHSSAVSYLS